MPLFGSSSPGGAFFCCTGAFPACEIPLIFPCCTRSLFCRGRRFAVKCERFVQPAQDCGFFLRLKSGDGHRSDSAGPGMSAHFSPLTLAVTAIFFIIKTGRWLRLTAIKARVTVFLFVPPARRFFWPGNMYTTAGVRCLSSEVQWRGQDPGVSSRAAIRDICPVWLKKIPKPRLRGRKGSEAVKFALRKTTTCCITPFSGRRRGSVGLLPVIRHS